MIEWNIQSRSHACQACAHPFADKQPYFTLLFEQKHGLERLDVCAACWESQYSQGANDRKGFISFWQGVFSVPPAAAVEPIQKESAEQLLRRLIELNDPQYGPASFILAVMLERKRVLKVKAQPIQDQHRTLIYEHSRTGELWAILDPDLKLAQLNDVQHQVAHLLEHGLNPPPEPAPAAPVVPENAVAVETPDVPSPEAILDAQETAVPAPGALPPEPPA